MGFDVSFFGLNATTPLTPFVVGLCMMTWTPIGAGLMHWGFYQLGTVISDDNVESNDVEELNDADR